MSGNLQPTLMENFDPVTVYSGIKYKGSLTQYFEMDGNATFSANVANTTVKMGIKKNGVLVASSVMGQFCKNANQLYHLSGTAVVEMALNDEIQLVITSDGTGDQITMEHYTTTVSEFFD